MALGTMPLPGASGMTWLDLAEQVALEHGVRVEVLLSRDRHAKVSKARHHFWGTLRGAGYTYPEIAETVGRKAPSIMAGVKKAAERLAGRSA